MKQTFTLDSLVQFAIGHGKRQNIVSPRESRANLEQNVVGLYNVQEVLSADGKELLDFLSAGCGLRLTTDGYILTAYHVIEAAYRTVIGENKNQTRPDYVLIRDSQNKCYPLDPSFISIDREHDIALVKAYSPDVGEPIPFNINWNSLLLFQKLTSVRLNHQSGEIEQSTGRVIKKNNITLRSLDDPDRIISDLFYTTTPVYQGNSGGIFIDSCGSLAGTISCARSIKNVKTGEFRRSYGVKIEYGLQLIGLTLASIFDIDLI